MRTIVSFILILGLSVCGRFTRSVECDHEKTAHNDRLSIGSLCDDAFKGPFNFLFKERKKEMKQKTDASFILDCNYPPSSHKDSSETVCSNNKSQTDSAEHPAHRKAETQLESKASVGERERERERG